VGSVKGKAGTFVGVDLGTEFQGKNDGSVAGVRYFSTAAPTSGMFIPLAKAEKIARSVVASPPMPRTTASAAHPRARTISGAASTTSAFVTPVGRPRQVTTGSTTTSTTVRGGNQSPLKTRFAGSPAGTTPGSITPKPPARPATSARIYNTSTNYTAPTVVVPPRPASVASTSSSISSRLSTSMDSSLQIQKLHRKVAALTEELLNLRDSKPLLEQTLKSKDKLVAEKEHALRLMEIERQNQRAELEEMERQVTQLQGFLEERSPHNSSAKIAGVDDAEDSVDVTDFQTKLELEELRREVEALKQEVANRDAMIRQLRMSPRTARVEDTAKLRELEELVAAYKQEISALESELDECRAQMKEDEIAQRGVVDQISVLEGVVENMERGLIAEKKMGERNARRIRELEAQLKAAEDQLAADEEERMRKKHTSVDHLPDSHPQKRQTVQFLEQEVEKWKRLSNLSTTGIATTNGRRTSIASGTSAESPEEVKGLKLIIEQLTRENVQVESENRRLKTKISDQSKPDSAIPSTPIATPPEPAATSGYAALRDRLEAAEREREHLRSELGELESLLESKIFKEEELERELEALRAGHSSTPPLRRKSASSGSGRPHSITPPRMSPPPPPISEEPVAVDENLWCEICEEKGHDILGCKAVFGDKPSASSSSTTRASVGNTGNNKVGMGERRSVGYCENCDRWDHATEGNHPPPLRLPPPC
jgi:hypothetical protein